MSVLRGDSMGEDILKGIPINSKGFGSISKLAMQDRNLHINAKAIYAYFNSFSGGGNSCFPTRKRICYDLGISIDTLSKYLRQLVDNGYIRVEQVKENGRFSHNIYTLCDTISPCPKISDTENTVYDRSDTNINSYNTNNIYNKNNINGEVRKKVSGYDEIINGYTSDNFLKSTIYEFIKMRKMIKKPLTDKALKLMLSKLDKMATSTGEKIAILNQSIMNSWQGIFEFKDSNKYIPPREETEGERLRREQQERLERMINGDG